MDWLFYVSPPQKSDRMGNLSLPPLYIHHFCLSSVLERGLFGGALQLFRGVHCAGVSQL